MFDMFSLKSAMITASVLQAGALSFCPTAGSKCCFIVFIKYVKVIYFVCHLGSKELIVLTLNYDIALNLLRKLLKTTKDVIRRYLKSIYFYRHSEEQKQLQLGSSSFYVRLVPQSLSSLWTEGCHRLLLPFQRSIFWCKWKLRNLDQLVVPEPSGGKNLGFQRSGTTQPDSSMKKKQMKERNIY